MVSCKSAYGYDDKWMRIVGIPFIALICPPVFFGNTYSTWPGYWHSVGISLIFALCIWEGSRPIFIHITNRFPAVQDNRKRIAWIIGLSLLYVLVVCPVVGTVVDTFFQNGIEPKEPSSFQKFGSSMILLLTVGAIYESRRLFRLWQDTLLEKEQLERAHLASQLEGLRNQVNPHFLFNSLNTLIYLIPEDQEKAVRFVQQLSKVYRYVLESRDAKMIPLRQELDFLYSYIYLLHERFGENLVVKIRDLEQRQNAVIVPLTLQLLFENAIKHNVISTEKPLKIEVFAENGHMVVRNNLQRKNQVMDSTGVGLQNIKDRYRILTEQQVEVITSQQYFTVALPMIELQNV